MDKLKEKLEMEIEDKKATLIILGTIIVTIAAVIGIYAMIGYNNSLETSSAESSNMGQQEVEDINSLTSVENLNSIEDLQKQNEKELKEAEKKEDNKKKTAKQTPSYYIKVNYGAQVVTVYAKDSKGKYTKPVKAMVCSTGVHTPTGGVYKTSNKWTWLKMIGGVYGHYVTQIVGDILFHSVPYLDTDSSTLEYWAYDKLGTRASLGCIRLTTKDALWIYNNCKLGTQVEFYSSSNPGPLGKPTARKISSAPKNIRGWDPTDPNPKNPWKEYLKKQEKEKKESKKKTDNKKNNDKNSNKNDKNNNNKNPDKNSGGSSSTGDKGGTTNIIEKPAGSVNEGAEPPVVNEDITVNTIVVNNI